MNKFFSVQPTSIYLFSASSNMINERLLFLSSRKPNMKSIGALNILGIMIILPCNRFSPYILFSWTMFKPLFLLDRCTRYSNTKKLSYLGWEKKLDMVVGLNT